MTEAVVQVSLSFAQQLLSTASGINADGQVRTSANEYFRVLETIVDAKVSRHVGGSRKISSHADAFAVHSTSSKYVSRQKEALQDDTGFSRKLVKWNITDQMEYVRRLVTTF